MIARMLDRLGCLLALLLLASPLMFLILLRGPRD